MMPTDLAAARPPAPPDVCQNCKRRPAVLDWVGEGGALAYVHGMHVRWCQRCAWEAQLDYARKSALQIPDLENKLSALLDLA